MKGIILALMALASLTVTAQKNNSLPIPSRQQLDWHEQEFYLFMHFGPNTFTNKEWGEGTEPEDLFDPGELDCRQWCRIAKEAGAKAIIITAKHHDGFCLWPSKFSKHTVRESKWKDGKGDVLKELSQACREYGLRFGVYISPWDRNHPDYGTEKYNSVFIGMLKELLQNYGPIWELWWDGANGEGPNGKKQSYDWKKFEATVRQTSPRTVIFSDIGPDIRWAGNESGIAGDPNWNYLDTAGFKRGAGSPPIDTLNHGNYNGKLWIPAECDVSIRPGWFWHEEENSKVKSPRQLFDLYLKSVGRGANLLLNVPPNNKGLISAEDESALLEFRKLRDASFGNNLLKDANIYYQFAGNGPLNKFDLTLKSLDSNSIAYTANLQNFVVELPVARKLNCIILREAIHLGQTVRKFRIELYNGRNKGDIIYGSSVGRKRILTFNEQTVTSFKVYLEDAKGQDNIKGISAYLVEESLLR